MSVFNQNSRGKNMLRNSYISTAAHFSTEAAAFLYRTIFIAILSSSYLGINGLFSNILSVLSLAELGIGTAITYRFYKPIAENDIEKVGQLTHYLRTVYLYIAGVVLAIGLLLFPFLDLLLKDAGEVPADIDLQRVYLLYLINTVSTYTYSYRFSLLNADQKHYINSLIQSGLVITRYLVQILILVLYRNFTLTLIASILFTFLVKVIAGKLATRAYAPVFSVRTRLPKEERKQILQDTKALMMHKIGGTVLQSTDNIVLAKFAGLAASGVYSNYLLIIGALQTALSQLLGNFTGSLGNAYASQTDAQNYQLFRKLQWVCLCAAGFCTAELFILVNDFILLWLRKEDMLFSTAPVIALCLQFFLVNSRHITNSYISATGCFVYDRYRPLLEAFLNLVISILLTQQIGIAGVFVGTIVSSLLTTFWRIPLILCRNAFHCPVKDYWIQYLSFLLLTAGYCAIAYAAKLLCRPSVTWMNWILQGVLCGIVYLALLWTIYHRSEEMQYFVTVCQRKLKRLHK